MKISHQEIAAELETAREVITRLLSEFKSNEYVSLARRQIERMIQYGIIRADFSALKAADAGVFIVNQLGRWFVGLRVLAPAAG